MTVPLNRDPNRTPQAAWFGGRGRTYGSGLSTGDTESRTGRRVDRWRPTSPSVATISHVLFIDESGNGQPGNSVTSLWVTAALAVEFERARELNVRIDALRAQNFRSRLKEVKGSEVPHGLARGRTIDDLAQDLAAILLEFEAHIWIAAVCRQSDGPTTKLVARKFILERVTGFLNRGDYAPAHWLIVWDVSDVQELGDFSRSVSDFRNEFSGEPRNDRLVPCVLGGLSHDWGGLQAADLLSNFALHFRGHQMAFPVVNLEKARAFETHLKPLVQKTKKGDPVGWKAW